MYILTNFHRILRQRYVKSGALSEIISSEEYALTLSTRTKKKLIENIMREFCVSHNDIELNARKQKGRIDIFRIENIDGECATHLDSVLEKKGNKVLFHVVYTAILKKNTLCMW